MTTVVTPADAKNQLEHLGAVLASLAHRVDVALEELVELGRWAQDAAEGDDDWDVKLRQLGLEEAWQRCADARASIAASSERWQ